MQHIVYKTTNLINGKYYIGVHSAKDINDEYLGSGKLIGLAVKKYGKENFKRETLSEWATREEAELEEKRCVDVNDPLTYNLIPGGGAPPIMQGEEHPLFGKERPDSRERMLKNNPAKNPKHRKAMSESAIGILVETGECRRFRKDDPRWGTGEIVSHNKGKITVRDSSGKIFKITKDDPRWISGEVIHITKGLPRTEAQMIKPEHTCPHCNRKGRGGAMLRWHFDNCKERV